MATPTGTTNDLIQMKTTTAKAQKASVVSHSVNIDSEEEGKGEEEEESRGRDLFAVARWWRWRRTLPTNPSMQVEPTEMGWWVVAMLIKRSKFVLIALAITEECAWRQCHCLWLMMMMIAITPPPRGYCLLVLRHCVSSLVVILLAQEWWTPSNQNYHPIVHDGCFCAICPIHPLPSTKAPPNHQLPTTA